MMTPPTRRTGVGAGVGQSEPSGRRAELAQILRLLTLAHHRNKNQHRRSRWWKGLDMLRRGVRRVVEEEEEAEAEAAATGLGGYGFGGDKKVMAERRVLFLRDRLVPRCWVAFSTLVADNQYAALGLMLIGVLARLRSVLGPADAPVAADVPAKEEDEVVGQKDVHVSVGVGVGVDEDLGVPLLRKDEELTEAGEGREGEEKHVRSEAAMAEKGGSMPREKRKKKKKHRDAIDELFSGLI